MNNLEEIKILPFENIQFHTGRFNNFADFIYDKIQSNKKVIIVHINLRNFYFLNKDLILKDKINKSCVSVFDGIGLKICFWLKGYGFLPDLNGTDLFPLVINRISKTNLKVFLLGSEEKIIQKAAKNILTNYPNLKLAGFHNGFFESKEELRVIKKINDSKADILLIGMGFPLQEQFVLKYKDLLQVSLIWNVGGLFDTISGFKPRAPFIIRKMRLEWLFRFIREPFRMLHRNTVCAFWSLGHIIFNKRSF